MNIYFFAIPFIIWLFLRALHSVPWHASLFLCQYTITLDGLLKTTLPKANSLKDKFAKRLTHLIDPFTKTVFLEGILAGLRGSKAQGTGTKEGAFQLSFLKLLLSPLLNLSTFWFNVYLIIKVFSFPTAFVERFSDFQEVSVFNYISP